MRGPVGFYKQIMLNLTVIVIYSLALWPAVVLIGPRWNSQPRHAPCAACSGMHAFLTCAHSACFPLFRFASRTLPASTLEAKLSMLANGCLLEVGGEAASCRLADTTRWVCSLLHAGSCELLYRWAKLCWARPLLCPSARGPAARSVGRGSLCPFPGTPAKWQCHLPCVSGVVPYKRSVTATSHAYVGPMRDSLPFLSCGCRCVCPL